MTTEVNFQLANLLKEKGFDTPTFYYYENENLVEPYLENGSSTDTEFRVDLSDLKEYFNKHSKRISAPTIAEVVMWLYEKHGIWIEVTVEQYSNGNNWLWQAINLRDAEKSTFVYGDNGEYKTPTEAYEAAIEYILINNLI